MKKLLLCASVLAPLALLALGLVFSDRLSHSAPDGGEIVLQKESPYQTVFVTRKGSVLTLHGGSLAMNSSRYDTAAPTRHVLEYTAVMCLALGYVAEPRNILVIGLGGATLTKSLTLALPEARIVSVEFDPVVVDVARGSFDFAPEERTPVVIQDARRYLSDTDERFDLVFLDAYHGDYIPFHLMTREFLSLVKSRLAPGGAVCANTWSRSALYYRESATYGAVFGRFDHYFGERSTNRIIIACGDGPPPDRATLAARMQAAKDRYDLPDVDLPGMFERLREEDPSWKPDTPLLLDDYAPVNELGGAERRAGGGEKP
jgi:spermidine synthase